MKPDITFSGLIGLGVVLTALLSVGAFYKYERVHTTQNGYRGTGMDQVVHPAVERMLKLANTLPDPTDKASADGDKATDVYKNVQVLKDLSADQFNRVMLSITEWVSPEQGCAYCHNVENLADDGLYTKKVARRMLEMNRYINIDWKAHVAGTGVTCYTCHHGKPVPENIWFTNPGAPRAGGFATTNQGMGHPNSINGSTGMSIDPLTPLLEGNGTIRVAATQALPTGYGASIQSTEQTYSLMIHMSKSLGVNCTFCHNTRTFGQWPESTPQRVTAWHGIQMTRNLNTTYLDPLKDTFPVNRKGPTGDAPKLDCATCHQGVNKPLNGASMAKDYPELGGASAP
jgi:photosynthetic reaction center cytochrome c subunit